MKFNQIEILRWLENGWAHDIEASSEQIIIPLISNEDISPEQYIKAKSKLSLLIEDWVENIDNQRDEVEMCINDYEKKIKLKAIMKKYLR
jgi:hypothetical protein